MCMPFGQKSNHLIHLEIIFKKNIAGYCKNHNTQLILSTFISSLFKFGLTKGLYPCFIRRSEGRMKARNDGIVKHGTTDSFTKDP